MDIGQDKVLTVDEAVDLVAFLDRRVENAPDSAANSAALDRLIVVALLSSGLRNSEFCALRLRDTILGRGESVFEVTGEQGRERVVHVPLSVSNMVRRYAEDARPRFVREGMDANDLDQPLLLSEHGRPFDRTGLYRRVVRILTEGGLGDRANVQLLRHTYGYLAYLRTGGNLLFVQRQLGHAHPATTVAYAELVPESYADLAERILPEAQAPGSPAGARGRRPASEFDCEVD